MLTSVNPKLSMRLIILSITALAALINLSLAAKVTIIKTHTAKCTRKTQVGDKITVHYRGSLKSNGFVFDSSYESSMPITFTVGNGEVIKGWDQNFSGMCVGDKRVLIIPPELAYGNRGTQNIPPKSTLVFGVELMGIEGVKGGVQYHG